MSFAKAIKTVEPFIGRAVSREAGDSRTEQRQARASLVDPATERRVREAAEMQRAVGAGRYPGVTHEEFMSTLMKAQDLWRLL
jgi:hypothetical protein